MKILMQDNFLGVRGTTTSLYDYAFFLKKKYGHECSITYNENDNKNDPRIIKKFQKEFELFPYKNFNKVNEIVKNNQIDTFYIQKAGDNDNKIASTIKTCVHAVFPCDLKEKHGDVYAYISEWLSKFCSDSTLPYVPYMLNLPNTDKNYRAALNIPEDAIVFGRYGGIETFDLPFVCDVIKTVVNQPLNKHIYFVFCNTFKFIDHPNVIFVNSTASLENKVTFINTCDALLHARYRGETFGLTILEFMSKNKPILTYGLSEEKNHYNLLDNQGLLYNNEIELSDLIKNFTPKHVEYKQTIKYFPNTVIEKFNDVFLT